MTFQRFCMSNIYHFNCFVFLTITNQKGVFYTYFKIKYTIINFNNVQSCGKGQYQEYSHDILCSFIQFAKYRIFCRFY